MKNGKKIVYYKNMKESSKSNNVKQRYKDSAWNDYNFNEKSMIYKGRIVNRKLSTTTITEIVNKKKSKSSTIQGNVNTTIKYEKIKKGKDKGKYKKITTIIVTSDTQQSIVSSSYTSSSDDCNINNVSIKNKALEIIGNSTNDYVKANKIYNWVRANIKYQEDLQLSASDALSTGKGNCVALSNLIVALSRSVSIPSQYETRYRFELGYAFLSNITQNQTLLKEGHEAHMWALVFMEDAVIPYNATNNLKLNGWFVSDGALDNKAIVKENFKNYSIAFEYGDWHYLKDPIVSDKYIYYLYAKGTENLWESVHKGCNFLFGDDHEDSGYWWINTNLDLSD